MSSDPTGYAVGGKYLLVERIGDGGMGSVWRAVHQGLAREVAVKLLDLDGAHAEERVERFLREAKMCAAVRHRYVVDIFDVDTTPQGQPYMVMELLRGQTLADRTARPPSMPADDLVRLLAQCLSGLGAVHRAGVVHRDLKPENIFLAQYDEGIVPKIVDFGISRGQWHLSSSGSRRLTRQGTVLGTPWYMSPEQARASEGVGPQTDVYSMGVIAYEALCGRLPFDSESLTELLLKITSEEATPLERVRPDLPRALSDVVAKSMARDPAKRFQTALEMRAALLRAIEGMDFSYAAVVPSEGTIVLPTEIDASGRPTVAETLVEPASSYPPRTTSGSYRRGLADTLSGDALPLGPEPTVTATASGPAPLRLALAIGAVTAIVVLAIAVAFLLGRSGRQPADASRTIAPLAPSSPSVAPTQPSQTIETPEPTVVADEPEAEAAVEAPIRDVRPARGKARPRRTRRTPPAAFRNLDF